MKISNAKGQRIGEKENLEIQRETFIASLSHDLKNPTLAQIRALELFLKGTFGNLSPKQKEIIGMILESCKYMNSMLCSILTTYRCEQGAIELANESVSISDLASECIDEVIFLAKEREIKMLVSNEAEVGTVWGDKVQLKRVVMNLLTNGIKYAYPKTILHVRIYNEDKYTCFSFENKSAYIEPQQQERIFARYVSFADSHKEIGVGLGLYASKKIVEAHEGTIFVESYQDERNIFGFKLPNSEIYKTKQRFVTF